MGILENIFAVLQSIDGKLGGNEINRVADAGLGSPDQHIQSAGAGADALNAGTLLPAATVGTAPALPVTTAAAPAADVALDSRGFPWDEQIHASSKEKIVKDDSWKKKRGVSAELVAQVEAGYVAQGYGTPVVTAPVVTAAPAGQPAGLAGLPTLPPINTPAPEKVAVQMPVLQLDATIDDNLMTVISAAAYATLGEPVIDQIMDLLKMAPDAAVTDVPDQYRMSFYRLCTDPALQAEYKIKLGA